MVISNTAAGACRRGPTCRHDVRILWCDLERRTQVKRFASGIQPQCCDEVAVQLHAAIKEQQANLPEGVRVDVPRPQVISRLIGVYRSAATLKSNPMLVLEMSAAEIAKLTGYSKSQIEAALRWLGTEIIYYKGQAVARGLGVITRTLRKGRLTVCGLVKNVFRTSLTALSEAGRALLGLITVTPDAKKPFNKDKFKEKRRRLLATARTQAFGQIKAAVRNFWGRSLTPENPPAADRTPRASEDGAPATGHMYEYFKRCATRVLAEEGKTFESCDRP